ncbi:MAG: class I SAM-dependent methyltransferase [Syntrophales bacterium]
MGAIRQVYYNLFSRIYDRIIRMHSRDRAGSLRGFITARTRVAGGDRVLDLCTGTGAVAVELARCVGNGGLVVGLDFSSGMLAKAKQKAAALNLVQVCFVRANAGQLPFKDFSFRGVTCSHAFYELTGSERVTAVAEVARVLEKGGRFCLMEHAVPEKLSVRVLFYIRLFFLGAKDVRQFLREEESIFGNRFKNIATEMSPSGQSKLIHAEKV